MCVTIRCELCFKRCEYVQKFPSGGSRFGITKRHRVRQNRDTGDEIFRSYQNPMIYTFFLQTLPWKVLVKLLLILRRNMYMFD